MLEGLKVSFDAFSNSFPRHHEKVIYNTVYKPFESLEKVTLKIFESLLQAFETHPRPWDRRAQNAGTDSMHEK